MKIRVVCFLDDDKWCAQCLEVDIFACGLTPEKTKEIFLLTLAVEMQLHDDWFDRIGPPPNRAFNRVTKTSLQWAFVPRRDAPNITIKWNGPDAS